MQRRMMLGFSLLVNFVEQLLLGLKLSELSVQFCHAPLKLQGSSLQLA